MRAHSEILLRADYRLTIVRGLLIIRNKIIFNGQSIVLTWMISYIVILLLPIAIVILNEENQILASNSTNTLPSDFPYTQLESSSNFYYTGSDGEKYEVFNIQSPRSKYATIMVASVPILILYPFVQKYFVKGVMIGAVKG